MKILAAQINPTVGDLSGNVEKISQALHAARQKQADLVLFPELALTGYPPEDLLELPAFMDEVERHFETLLKRSMGITAVIGLPRRNPDAKGRALFNSAAVIQNGVLLGYYDKKLLPTYDVFDEHRYFEPGTGAKVWNLLGRRVAITICEDIWHDSIGHYAWDPIFDLKAIQPDLLLNLSASPYSIEKPERRLHVCQETARTLLCSLVLCNQVGGNDSLIFDGFSLSVDAAGTLTHLAKGFEEDLLWVDLEAPAEVAQGERHKVEDLFHALVLGLRDYFKKSGFVKACLGLSGGIDSAVVAYIAAQALSPENVLGISMPSRFSSSESLRDAEQLAKHLGIGYREISIESPFSAYLSMLEPHFSGKPFDVTEENLQARIRGMLLMAFSNKMGYIVLSTGNKSEMALGYATLYGDMCGGIGVISDVTKTQVYALARWINRDHEIIPRSTLEKPPSAELRPNQKDSDSLPDYEIVDRVLDQYVEKHLSPTMIAKKFSYPQSVVDDLVRRIHINEYKRRQAPPGLRVTEKAFSAGRRFPIVEKFVR